MGFPDSTIISLALAANPTLRENLREVVSRITQDAFSDATCGEIEREVVAHFRIDDAMKMPNALPARGHPLPLRRDQVAIIKSTISRFKDAQLRSNLLAHVDAAIGRGAIVEV